MANPTIGLQDLRFLLSRVRGEWLPEEQGGLAPRGPTGIRDVQGVGNNTLNELSPNWWFGAADTLFPRLTFNRLTAPGLKNDTISSPFANSQRGPDKIIAIADTTVDQGSVDALNPRNISNLIADSSNPAGFQSLDPNDPDYAAKLELKLMDDPAGRISPVSGAINPLPYSNWMSQFGQFFDHGLDFVNKGVDGKVTVELLPSDGLYTANRATSITASRNNTANITLGEGSTDALLDKLGLLDQEGKPSWSINATLTKPAVSGSPEGSIFAYEGTLVLNNTLIEIAAVDELDLVNQINLYTPTTGVVATATPFPAIPNPTVAGTYIVPPDSFQLTLNPARAESFNQVSPFIDLSQSYGSDNSRTVFLREYLSEEEWRGALGDNGLEATITDLTTGRLVNASASVNGELKAGIANWAQIKANAAKVGITLHDADVMGIPMVAFDNNGQLLLDADGMPQLVALNKVTGEVVYVKNTTLADDAAIDAAIDAANQAVLEGRTDWSASDFVLMTTKHAFLNDMGVRLPPLTDATVWDGRDLKNDVFDVRSGQTVDYKTLLEAHYIAGDGRLNENIGLTAVQEVFVNEHNRVLTLLKQQYGFTGEQPAGGWTWTDPLTGVSTQITGEELFQQAKLFNEMTYQHLVFDQFVRKLSPNIAGFAGVDPLIDARVSAEFAHAVYRLGHSMLPEAVGMRQYADATKISTVAGSAEVTVTLTNHGLTDGALVTISSVDSAIGGIDADLLNGEFTVTVLDNNRFTFTATDSVSATGNATGLASDKIQIDINKGLIEAFLNPQSYIPGYTAALLSDGSTAQVGNRIDEKVTDALRDNLLGQPLDLATLNLVRGRDAGLPTLNEMRGAIQAVAPVLLQPTLNPYTSWTNFRDNLKGTLADQNATVKNFIMAYASDDILSKFATTKTVQQWYDLRDSTVVQDQNEYMAALKAAADSAFNNATWMGTGGNKDFNRIDAWIGGLAEREVVGGMLGSTFDAVFAMQMMALQNGDSLYYLGRIPAEEFFIENMEGIQLSDIVMRATGATNIYGDIFSVADKYLQTGDVGEPAPVGSLELLQASTTTQRVFDGSGELVLAAIGRAGFVTQGGVTTYYGNPGNYVDARGVLNPNGVGNASEMIAGTAGVDRISALGGNDTVRAAAGNDIIDGGSGVDFLYGGDGNDVIDGGSEDDFIYGEGGNDTMRGGIGIDTMFGGDGNDTMFGGADGDVMIGGTGDDIMYGGDGITVGGILDPEPLVGVGPLDDTINGGQGNDTIYGGGGWDSLNGDSGHDTLFPGTGGADQLGREAMDGGEGDDIYIIEGIADFANMDIADTGLTELQLVNKGTGFRQGNGLGIDEVRFTDTVAGDIVIAGTNVLGVPSIFTGVERIVIGTGTGTTANRNGTADINIDASLANPGLNVGLEILGNAGVNIIVGTAFSDVIDGGGDADTLEGGLGNDTYVVDNLNDLIIETTGGGNDTVRSSITYTLGSELENLVLTGNAAQGTGNSLGNTITGNGIANILRGLDGDDAIDGGGGNDTIFGGAGIDILTGGTGNDTFVFSSVAEIGNDAARRETITDFRTGTDLIDLTGIDANDLLSGHQAFDYANITTADFEAGTAGRLRYADGVLYGETTGDGVEDFQIALPGAPATLTSDMFVANPTLSIARAQALPVGGLNEGNAGTVNHTFTVTLSRASSVNTTVAWAVSGTGADPANATDFANGSFPGGTLTIAAGQTTGTITVPVRGDTTAEATETFQVTISNPTGPAVLGTVTATSTIQNDDSPVISIAGPGGTGATEGNTGTSSHTFTVNLSSAATAPTTVNWAVTGTGASPANATDFGGTLPSGSVTIAVGATSATFTVNVAGDTSVEANETFQVTLSNPPAGTQLGTATATSTIINDDAGTVVSQTINGTSANNTLNGTAGADAINGLRGNDTLNGNAGDDVMNGGTGNDTLNGGGGNDTLDGGTGTDILNGGNGNDLLIGSAGRDTMTGGAGSDVFRFNASVTEIGNLRFGFSTTNDRIMDFARGQDIIDLSAIDANTSDAGDQAFTYIGSASFSGLGQLRYQNGQLQGNVTGGNAADFTISIVNNPATLTAGDFIL
jgi:Ca2+-binding RTX toxin-like protein